MQVNVDIDVKDIPPKINKATPKGQFALVNQVHADMNPYVPALNFDLRNQSTIAIDGKTILYHVPYAKKQFYIQHKNYTTHGTGPRWDLKAKSIHGASWERVAGRAMNL